MSAHTPVTRCPRCGGKSKPIATNISNYGTKWWYRCLGFCGKEFPSTKEPKVMSAHTPQDENQAGYVLIGGGIGASERESNARLIAAAPALLEALERMLNALPAGEKWPLYLSDAVIEARKAINYCVSETQESGAAIRAAKGESA